MMKTTTLADLVGRFLAGQDFPNRLTVLVLPKFLNGSPGDKIMIPTTGKHDPKVGPTVPVNLVKFENQILGKVVLAGFEAATKTLVISGPWDSKGESDD